MTDLMRGASAESLGRLAEDLDAAATGGDGVRLGTDLFAAAGVLRGQAALRRAATDPSADPAARQGLLERVFTDKLGAAAVALLGKAGGQRWVASTDLAAALERLAVVALVRAAEASGEADRLEDELFSVGRALVDHRDLRDALAHPARSVEDRTALAARLLEGKALPSTVQLVEQAVASEKTTAAALAAYSEIAADTRNRKVALVRVASPLDPGAQERLAAVLARDFGQQVHLNVVVDPTLVGGIRVEIGDQVIDGSIVSRLDAARRALVG